MFKKIKQSNLFLFLLIMTVTFGLSLSLQSVFAYKFKTGDTGFEVGNDPAQPIGLTSSNQNLFYAIITGTSSTGHFIKLQKGIDTDKFKIDHDGNTWAAGDICSGNTCLSDFAAFSEANTLQTVTSRGAITDKAITINNNLTISGTVDGYDISNFGQYFIDSDGTSGQVWKSDGSGKGVWGTELTEANVESYIANDINTGYIPYDNGSKLISSGLYYTSNRLGIANSAPGYPLHIQDDNSTAILNIDNEGDALWTGIRLERNNAEKWFIGMNNTDAKLRLRRSGANDDLVIDESGNVGIGTTGPGAKLEINKGGTDYPEVLRLKSDIDGIGGPMLTFATANDNQGVFAQIRSHFFNTLGGSLIFDTANSSEILESRMIITSEGNVGIGTTGPGAKLDVSGTIRAQEICDETGANCKDISTGWASIAEVDGIIGNEIVGAANATLTRSGAGTSGDPYKLALNLGNANTWTANQAFPNDSITDTMVSNTLTASDLVASSAVVSDTEVVDTITASNYVPLAGGVNITGGLNIAGNVGIGTTGPGYKLSVADTGTIPIVNIWNNSATSQWTGTRLARGGTGDGSEKWFIGMNATDGKLRFRSAGENDDFVIDEDGNVGIGTTAPGAKLDVTGSIRAQEICDETGWNCKDISTGWSSGVGDGYSLDAADGSPADALYINSNGDVGIGTTNPVSKLSVKGTLAVGSTYAETLPQIWEGAIIEGYVGIGTAFPHYRLSVADTGEKPIINIWNNSNTKQWTGMRLTRGGIDDGTEKWFIGMNNSDAKLRLRRSSANDDLVIDESGNVGIGITDPESLLEIKLATANPILTLTAAHDSDYDPMVKFKTDSIDTVKFSMGVDAGDSDKFKIYSGANIGETGEFVIDGNGRVGIGTAMPEGLLEIQGTEGADAVVYLDADDGDDNGDTWIIKSQTDNDLTFTNHTSELLRITDSGKVGIGMNFPGYRLSVADTGTVPIVNIWNNSATNQWTGTRLARGGTGDGLEKWFMGMNAEDGKLRFRRSGENDDLVIDESGNVGIGTTAPGAKLDVTGSIRAQEICDETGWNCKDISTGWSSGVGDGYSLDAADGSPTDALYINNDGMIGIGTTNPGAKLEIAGQIKITGGSPGANKVLMSDANGLATWANEIDGIAGNEVVNASNSTLTRGGSGTLASPYTLGLNLANANTWTGIQTFNGRVGIGTTSPEEKFHVTDVDMAGLLIRPESDSVALMYDLADGAGTFVSLRMGWDKTIIRGNVGIDETNPASKLSVSGGASIGGSYDTTAAPSNGLIVEGNVGIGETNPASKLSVSGGASIGISYDTKAAPSNGLIVEGNVGIGTSNPQTRMDVRGSISLGSAVHSLFDGQQDNMQLSDRSFCKLAPFGDITLTGIAGGVDGKILILYNSSNYTMTIANNNSSSLDENRIYTMTGSNRSTSGPGSVTLIYDSQSAKWIVISFEQ